MAIGELSKQNELKIISAAERHEIGMNVGRNKMKSLAFHGLYELFSQAITQRWLEEI